GRPLDDDAGAQFRQRITVARRDGHAPLAREGFARDSNRHSHEVSPFSLADQMIERTTPPSTRSAVPFVAEESGLATNATNAATSSAVANRLRSEVGRTVSKNSFSTTNGSTPRDFAISLTNCSSPSSRVSPAQTALTVPPVPCLR